MHTALDAVRVFETAVVALAVLTLALLAIYWRKPLGALIGRLTHFHYKDEKREVGLDAAPETPHELGEAILAAAQRGHGEGISPPDLLFPIPSWPRVTPPSALIEGLLGVFLANARWLMVDRGANEAAAVDSLDQLFELARAKHMLDDEPRYMHPEPGLPIRLLQVLDLKRRNDEKWLDAGYGQEGYADQMNGAVAQIEAAYQYLRARLHEPAPVVPAGE